MDRYPYPPRAMTSAEAAHYVGLTSPLFRRSAAHAKAFEIASGEWRWDRSDLDEFIDSMKGAHDERKSPDDIPRGKGIPPAPRSVFTAKELAVRWDLSHSTIMSRFKEGRVPGFHIGKSVRFPIKLVLELEREEGIEVAGQR